MLYSHATALDGKHVTLHILDTVGQVSIGWVSFLWVILNDQINIFSVMLGRVPVLQG